MVINLWLLVLLVYQVPTKNSKDSTLTNDGSLDSPLQLRPSNFIKIIKRTLISSQSLILTETTLTIFSRDHGMKYVQAVKAPGQNMKETVVIPASLASQSHLQNSAGGK